MTERERDLRVDEIDAVDPSEWEDLLRRDPMATVLHRPDVNRRIAAGLVGAHPRWLEVRDPEGGLRGGLALVERRRFGLARIVSGAAGLYGGPVVDPDCAEVAGDALARAFAEVGGRRTVARELVWGGRTPPAGKWEGLRPLPTAALRVEPTSDFDAWYTSSLRTSRRKERKRLLRQGLRAELAEDARFLDEFHPLYARRCAKWGTRPLGLDLLAGLLESDERWRAFVVRDADDGLVGAHLCVDLGTELFAWLGTARRVEGGAAATMLIEAELRWCHAHARQGLNLGTSADLAGVSEFKRGVSAIDDARWIVRWQRGRGYR